MLDLTVTGSRRLKCEACGTPGVSMAFMIEFLTALGTGGWGNGGEQDDGPEIVIVAQRKPKLAYDPAVLYYHDVLTFRGSPIGCSNGSMVNVGGGVSATGFLGVLGLSGGLGVGISVPSESLMHFSLRGTQISLSGSLVPLLGFGLFLGVGSTYSIGGSNGSSENLTGSVTPVIQAGAGDGAGVEVSSDLTSPLNVGGAMGRIAGGAYGALGARFAGTVATDPIGC
jgi:hypothetical protein